MHTPRPPGLSFPGHQGIPHTVSMASAQPHPQPMGQELRPRLTLRVWPSDRNPDVFSGTHRLSSESSRQKGADMNSAAFPSGLQSLAARVCQTTAAATHASCDHGGDITPR